MLTYIQWLQKVFWPLHICTLYCVDELVFWMEWIKLPFSTINLECWPTTPLVGSLNVTLKVTRKPQSSRIRTKDQRTEVHHQIDQHKSSRQLENHQQQQEGSRHAEQHVHASVANTFHRSLCTHGRTKTEKLLTPKWNFSLRFCRFCLNYTLLICVCM